MNELLRELRGRRSKICADMRALLGKTEAEGRGATEAELTDLNESAIESTLNKAIEDWLHLYPVAADWLRQHGYRPDKGEFGEPPPRDRGD